MDNIHFRNCLRPHGEYFITRLGVRLIVAAVAAKSCRCVKARGRDVSAGFKKSDQRHATQRWGPRSGQPFPFISRYCSRGRWRAVTYSPSANLPAGGWASGLVDGWAGIR